MDAAWTQSIDTEEAGLRAGVAVRAWRSEGAGGLSCAVGYGRQGLWRCRLLRVQVSRPVFM